MPRLTLTDEERFLQKINKTDTCWLWTAGKFPFGYGQFYYNNKCIQAHRYAYIKYNGEIPEGQLIRHKCDVPSCCNPAHLELGTQADNIRDCIERGRFINGKQKLTLEIVHQIRKEFNEGNITRKELSLKYNIDYLHCIKIINKSIWKE